MPSVPGLPADWPGCTINGSFMYSDGTPLSNAQYKLTPSPAYVKDASVKEIILGVPLTNTLNTSGQIVGLDGATLGYTIASSDDPDINPTSWTWRFEFLTPAAAKAQFTPFNFNAPSGGTIDLFDSIPLTASNGTVIVQGNPGIVVIAFGATAPPVGTPAGTVVARYAS